MKSHDPPTSPHSLETPLKPTPGFWILSYVLSPALPFICLRIARAIGLIECILGVITSLAVHLGLISVLVATEGNRLHIFIVLLLGYSLYIIFLWQYLAGLRTAIWSPNARKQWRIAGIFFGAILVVALLGAILHFHLSEINRPPNG